MMSTFKKRIVLLLIGQFIGTSISFASKYIQSDTVKKDTLTIIDSVRSSNYTVEDFKRIEYPKPQQKLGQASNLQMVNTQSVISTPDAGRTTASLDVSPSGAATYNVPISVPPGINGVVPPIALSYNSQAGNGMAGYGWNLSGLHTISRIPRTKFHDGVTGGVNVNMDDRYALDGQRLILKSGTYGADGAEYQTESYSNVRIVSKGTGTNGPDHFEVYYPDGSKAFFGANALSKTPTDYAITYSENSQGIRITYQYTLNDNTLNISLIEYGAKGTGTAINRITFTYKDRQRNEQGYVGGYNFFRSKILSEINVTGNSFPYRKYVLNYSTVSILGYERLTSVQEQDGSGTKAFAPIYFNYDESNATITTSYNDHLSYANLNSANANMITGDYNGDGQMDMVLYSTYPKKGASWIFIDPKTSDSLSAQGILIDTNKFEDVFTVTALSSDNKIKAGDAFAFVYQNNPNTLTFALYGSSSTQNVISLYNKIWDTVPTTPSYYSDCIGQNVPPGQIPRVFVSGDFNGDGLTDIIAISKTFSYPTNCHNNRDSVTTSTAHFINLDRRLTSNFVNQAGNLAVGVGPNDKVYAADFNGDGKSDIIHITNGTMYVYELDASNNLSLMSTTADTRILTDFPAMLGDYNGDGKMDVMFPTNVYAPYNSLFALFTSTGSSGNLFTKIEQSYPFAYTKYATSGSTITETVLVPNDVNRDGKTDIISCTTTTTVSGTTGDISVTFYNNVGSSSATTAPLYDNGVTNSVSSVPLSKFPLPLFFSPNQVNLDRQFALASGSSMHFFNYEKDLTKETRVKQFYQDGVAYYVDYQPLTTTVPSGLPVYDYSNTPAYPYIGIEEAPAFNVVSKLRRNFNGSDLIQAFYYHNAVFNAEGLGFLGFGQTVRSNWITSETDANKVYTVNITDPLLRGTPIRSFTTKNPSFNTAIKDMAGPPADTVLQTAVLTSQTTVAAKSITLSPGFSANGSNGAFIAKITDPAAGINDGATISDYITRTDYTYNTQLSSSKVFINTPLSVSAKNLLSGTNTLITYAYDSYYNVTNETTNLSGTGIKTTDITYDNNPSGGYIGRPLTKKQNITSNGDSFSTEEQYSYTGFLPTQIKKKGNGTPFITDDITYDTYGNVTSKTTTTSSGTRTVSMQYDVTGRFMTKSTDVEGLETNYTYSPYFGTLSTKTDPYGHLTTYYYDSWNRSAQVIDYLGASSYTTYQRNTSGYDWDIVIEETDDEGHDKKSIINPLGETTSVVAKDVLGQMISKASQYDVYDRTAAVSEPYTSSASQWNQTEYDEYGRVKRLTAFTGKITNISYNGLSTTVNDGTKSVTTTKDALGNVISTTDPGGTINNTYFANGNLKSADFAGSAQTIEQDGWGRKTKLTDPSAGVYTYAYDDFGNVTTETTPKGSTSYVYDVNSKLQSKHITGDNTDMSYTYTYNGTSKLLTATSLINTDGNSTNYTYTYDSYMRPNSTVEDNAYAKFTKTLTYDTYGRVATEASEAKNKSNSLTVSKTILNTYQYGELKSISDNGTGQSIWTVSSLDARGNVTTALLGAALKETSTFDAYGLPQEIKTDRVSGTPAQLMKLNYSFDAQRGNLTSRTTTVNTGVPYTSNESFTYDTQDRLTGYPDIGGSQTQSYDNRGRIQINSHIGTYTYTGNSYQQKGLVSMTDFAKYHYQSDSLQQVTYNAFKQPVEIIERGKEKISFEYNGDLNRSHMFYGDTTVDKLLRPLRRHYSEDGSMEITEDIPNGKTSFVFYLGGDAYSAPAIWKNEQTATTTVEGLHYLHRDYQGSILMITDASGNVEERRQFDAWGNIVKLTDGAGTVLTAFAILDRGYTGHEHLLGVGLINMNGRLYDPLLHRFLSPDEYVQDPTNTQNFNRYGYVLNNPLRYTDRSGNFLVELAVLAGVVNWATHGAQFNWKGLGYFGIGFASVLIGDGAVSAFSSLIGAGAGFGLGFMSGAAAGAVGGFAGGFASGLGNGLYGGGNLWSSLGSGLREGGTDALGGAIFGGLAGGANALDNHLNYFTGGGDVVSDIPLGDIAPGNDRYSSTAEMKADYNANIGDKDTFYMDDIEENFHTTVSLGGPDNLPNGYSMNDRGFMLNTEGHTVGGTTTGHYAGGFANPSTSSDIRFSPALKRFDLNTRNGIFKHEFMHAWHLTIMPNRNFYKKYSENATSNFSHDYYNVFHMGQNIGSFTWGYSPSQYSYKEFNKILPLWIK
ncbi:MAG TPA: RHS repeat-associated core domain-containing protein [Mucilaginibacter sp.]